MIKPEPALEASIPVSYLQGCPVSGLRKAWRGKIPQRSEDDFSPANPFRGPALPNPQGHWATFAGKKWNRADSFLYLIFRTAVKDRGCESRFRFHILFPIPYNNK